MQVDAMNLNVNWPDNRRWATTGRLTIWLVMLSCVLWLGGCGGSGGLGNKKPDPIAVYDGLAGQSVAVLVNADEYTYFSYPGAAAEIARSISAGLDRSGQAVRMVDPRQVTEFQKNHPYWNSMLYGELLQRLQVQRLVYVDVVQFSTHEMGNKHVWRGMIHGRVSVAEKEAGNPNQFAFSEDLRIEYPPDQPVGVLEADDAKLRAGMIRTFAERAVFVLGATGNANAKSK